MTMIKKALEFAKQKHAGQFRKVSGDAYVTHVIHVSCIVSMYKRSGRIEELLTASLLHDCLEDTNTDFLELAREFTPMVASTVLELTNDPDLIASMGKLEYHKKKLTGMSSYALVIKLADRLHNVSDNPTPKMISDTQELMHHIMKSRKLSGTHERLVCEILSICRAKS